MANDVFWANPGNVTPPRGVITTDSLGDQQIGPVGFVPGTSAGALPAEFTAAAQRVYPWNFDYSDTKRAAEYAALVSTQFSQFSSWHSLYQAKYIAENGPVTIGAPNVAPEAYFLLLGDGRSVLNVMSLSLAEYQKLSRADRQMLEGNGVFLQYMAPTLGLKSKNEADSEGKTVVSTLSSAMGLVNGADRMTPSDRQVFTDQLTIISRRLADATLVVPGNYNKEIGAIVERFQRVKEFVGWQTEINLETRFEGTELDYLHSTLQSDVKGYAFSSDSGATVRQGYTEFMRAEREMLTAQLRREAIARVTSVFDPKKDAAQLIYQLQLMYQSETDARVDAGTEEMAQLHQLLSDYAIIQRLVNETLKAFNPKNADEKRRFMNIGGKADGNVVTAQDNGKDENTQIIYQFAGSAPIVIGPDGNKDKGEVWFDKAPGFHWYMLAGTPGNARIGSGDIDSYDGDGNYLGVFGETVYQRYKTFERGDIVLSGGLSDAEMRVVGMFSKDPWASGSRYQAHPIETLYGAPQRPTQDLTDESSGGRGSLTLQRRDYWDKWSTQLSDSVTVLNQKNQLKQNEIDSDSKQSNRYFDLGNNALRKMNEMLMSIGRM